MVWNRRPTANLRENLDYAPGAYRPSASGAVRTRSRDRRRKLIRNLVTTLAEKPAEIQTTGDGIKNLIPEGRELARERLHSLARTLIRIARRQVEEERQPRLSAARLWR